mmetsp:Transcript_85936/g.139332  ORF Transcript_85936/g.139332 Transcript_85936/m.139332 type:complete len:187 (+) Transcript_85936:250-810(+)
MCLHVCYSLHVYDLPDFEAIACGTLSTSTRNISKSPAAYAELFLSLFKAHQTQTHADTRAYTKAEIKGLCGLYRSRQGPLGHYLPYPTMKMCCSVLQHAAAATTAAYRSRTRPPWSLSAIPPDVAVLQSVSTHNCNNYSLLISPLSPLITASITPQYRCVAVCCNTLQLQKLQPTDRAQDPHGRCL